MAFGFCLNGEIQVERKLLMRTERSSKMVRQQGMFPNLAGCQHLLGLLQKTNFGQQLPCVTTRW